LAKVSVTESGRLPGEARDTMSARMLRNHRPLCRTPRIRGRMPVLVTSCRPPCRQAARPMPTHNPILHMDFAFPDAYERRNLDPSNIHFRLEFGPPPCERRALIGNPTPRPFL
jgi:hypothetical protein